MHQRAEDGQVIAREIEKKIENRNANNDHTSKCIIFTLLEMKGRKPRDEQNYYKPDIL